MACGAEGSRPPTASPIPAQPAMARYKGAGIDPQGFDVGKLIKGRKRHTRVDKLGLLLRALVAAADVQDHDGGVLLLSALFGQFPFLRKLFADSAYTGPIIQQAFGNIIPTLAIEIVKRRDSAKGFLVEPQRWIVERTISWLNRYRRDRQGLGNRNHNALAFLPHASIRLMLRRLCDPL